MGPVIASITARAETRERCAAVTRSMLRRRLAYEAHRVVQTPRSFANWPSLLAGLAAERLGRGSAEVTFRHREGRTIVVPNAPGARVPPYEVFADDSYDLAWFLGDLVDRPIRALDIGAHVGTFTCRLTQLHPTAIVHSFEPSPDTAAYLRRNVAANGLLDRVTVHEAAVAGATGTLRFDLEGAGSGHNHRVFDDRPDAGTEVPAISLDDIVADLGGPFDLVKMDCEGGEYDLVYGSSPEHWAQVERLVLEYHPVEGHSWEALRDWFAARGLHVVRHEAGDVTPGLGVAWLSRSPLRDPPGSGERSRIGTLAYEVRRVAQTPTTFRNWPALLGGMVGQRFGRGPEELTFATRSGRRIVTPNVPGARLPAYEQFAEDGYDLDWFLQGLLDRPIHGIDVGAHVGTFAVHFAEVHPAATLTCFEPSAHTAGYLRANLEHNGLRDRVAVEEAALTGATGVAHFDEVDEASVHSSLVHDGAPRPGAVEVRTLSFDDVVAAAPAPIAFVKLDCEGGEYELAYRSSPESWSTVERVVLEYHDIPTASWAELRAWFAGVGLHLVRQRAVRADLGLAWLARGPIG